MKGRDVRWILVGFMEGPLDVILAVSDRRGNL